MGEALLVQKTRSGFSIANVTRFGSRVFHLKFTGFCSPRMYTPLPFSIIISVMSPASLWRPSQLPTKAGLVFLKPKYHVVRPPPQQQHDSSRAPPTPRPMYRPFLLFVSGELVLSPFEAMISPWSIDRPD